MFNIYVLKFKYIYALKLDNLFKINYNHLISTSPLAYWILVSLESKISGSQSISCPLNNYNF